MRTDPAPTIAVFCNTFLPYSQTFVWDEIRSHERYEVEVFAWRRRNDALFPCEVHVARPWFPVTRHCRSFEKRFAQGGIALVHAHFGWAGVLAEGFARRHGLPLVVTFHGYDVTLLNSGRLGPPGVWPYTLHARSMLRNLDLGLCASAELLELLVRVGVPANKLIEHRLGVDVERFRPQPRNASDLHVAMVGRFVEKKGFADGIRAFAAAVSAPGVRAHLSIVGDGPLDQTLRALVETLGIDAKVTFLGALPHAGVAELLSRSDILLAPSAVAADGDRDSGLLSAKEASACECIPIATRHGGIPTIIEDGVTGFLVDEHDAHAIADRIVLLAKDEEKRRLMGRNARAKMQREFDLRGSVCMLESHYDEVIRRHTPSDRLSAGTVVPRPSSQ